MTPTQRPLKRDVGVRELHDQHSQYVRERGLVQEPSAEWLPRPSGRPRPRAPVSDLVAEQRR